MGTEAEGFCERKCGSFLLLYILVSSRSHNGIVRNLLNHYAFINSVPSAVILVDRVIDFAERFDFRLDAWVFNYLLNGYVRARRYANLITCDSIFLY